MIIFALTFLFLCPCLSQAEILVLQSGQKIQGKIVDQDKESLHLDVGLKIPLTYFFNEIKQILPDPPRPKLKLKKKQAPGDKAQQLESQAADLMDGGDTEQGITLMQQALKERPTAMRHMNYGSMLFGQGALAFKEGQESQAMETLHEAEQELLTAIGGLDQIKERMFLAKAYFLLGEIYFNAYSDKDKAKSHYLKSLSYYNNPSAKAVLEKLGN